MKNSKKIIIAVISIVIVMCLTVVLEIITENRYVKKYDTEGIRARVVDWYDNMRVMDYIDATSLFGYDVTADEVDSVFLTTLDGEITTDTMVIAIINAEDTSTYYEIFSGFLDARKLFTDDTELLDYYDKAKLVQGDNYIYLLLSNDTDMLEKELAGFYY